MGTVIERIVACSRCAERGAYFRGLGYEVLDCQPRPGHPGDCVLRLVDPTLDGAPPAPGGGAPPTPPAPADGAG